MKNWLVMALTIFGTFTMAEQSDATFANVYPGNVMISADGFYVHAFADGMTSPARLAGSLAAGFFLLPGFALGVKAGGDGYIGRNYFAAVGPMARLFFVRVQNLGMYLQGEFSHNFSASASEEMIAGDLGVDVFLTPSVAFGPKLRVSHIFPGPTSFESNIVTILASFSIYL